MAFQSLKLKGDGNGSDEKYRSSEPASAPSTVAPRPHLATVILGVVSSVVSISALITSLLSLHNSEVATKASERATRASQRAYIVIRNARVTTVRGPDPNMEPMIPEPYVDVVRVIQSFTVRNIGKTPAEIGSLKMKFTVPNEWQFATHYLHMPKGGDLFDTSWHGTVLQGDEVSLNSEPEFVLTREAIRAYDKWPRDGVRIVTSLTKLKVKRVYLDCELEYSDVFGEHHSVDWLVASPN